jgi:hypothetical protein
MTQIFAISVVTHRTAAGQAEKHGQDAAQCHRVQGRGVFARRAQPARRQAARGHAGQHVGGILHVAGEDLEVCGKSVGYDGITQARTGHARRHHRKVPAAPGGGRVASPKVCDKCCDQINAGDHAQFAITPQTPTAAPQVRPRFCSAHNEKPPL